MKISDDRKMNEHKRILENLLSSTLSEPNAEQHTTSSIAITITCDRIKTLMSEYPDLFPDECNPEADGTVYDKISEIPHDARNVTFALDLHPFNCISFRNSSALVDRMAVSIREDRPLLGNGLYIIEGRVYSSQEAIDNFDSVKNADSCYQLLHAFKHLADYKSGNTCIIIGGVAKLLEYSTNGLKGNDLCDVRCGLDTFLEITNGKDERLKQLLRSEINNHVPTTASPLERIIAFMNSIGTIISSFRLCESQYLNPFESQNLRASYNKKIKAFGNEIRSSLQNLKAEMLVFLSMFFAMSEVYSSNNNEINFLIVISLLIAGIICFALLASDRKQLKALQVRIKHEIDELHKAETDKDNNKDIPEFLKEFNSLAKSSKRNSILLVVAQVASFLPAITAIMICFAGTPSSSEIIIRF